MSTEQSLLAEEIIAVKELNDERFDGILVISPSDIVSQVEGLSKNLSSALELDKGLQTEIGVIPLPEFKAKRIIFSPTGYLDPDYDDVRCFRKAANKAIKRAIKAGVEKPLVYLQVHPQFRNASLVTLLGILEGLYVPLQIREEAPQKLHRIKAVGVFAKTPDDLENLIRTASILEAGRRVVCDIGDSDPERMAPPRVEQYITELFSKSSIKITVIKEVKDFIKDYPLFEAVNRAASNIERHQGRIIFLEYEPKEEVKKTLFFVGKGVTYDTGGADIKISGGMGGMSRDKCGAATAVGFLKMVEIIQPKNLRVVVGIAVVRNSVGSNSYVQDELIKSRRGLLVRIGNTDAEGRTIMADVLCKVKEMALDAVNPHIYTIATLTGHAKLTAGYGYNIVIDNGPARKERHAQKLQYMGGEISDPYEISVLRIEDFQPIKGQGLGDDVHQCGKKPSVSTERGHQFPMAFLMTTSGLDKHGSCHSKPLKYSHIDIAGSSLNYPDPATGSPVLSLAFTHLFNAEGCCSVER